VRTPHTARWRARTPLPFTRALRTRGARRRLNKTHWQNASMAGFSLLLACAWARQRKHARGTVRRFHRLSMGGGLQHTVAGTEGLPAARGAAPKSGKPLATRKKAGRQAHGGTLTLPASCLKALVSSSGHGLMSSYEKLKDSQTAGIEKRRRR